MTVQSGVLVDSTGTIVSVVYGWGDNSVPPEGQTYVAAADGNYIPGQSVIGVFTASVKAAITSSDTTMLRIAEAVSLGLTTWLTADVVAWVNYRRALRQLLSATEATSLPVRPAFPVGTD